jgi:pantoate--beta-alanine ligase
VLIVQTAAELRVELARARDDARVLGDGRIAFVPTMGALHAGHLALVDEARRRADVVVMSIFVNPLQFGPGEDLARYPRPFDADVAQARARGVGLLFAPGVDELYPREPRVRVLPGALADRWEGAVRPGHFGGVLTVVAKLFHLVQPDVAIFGQKDAQQAALVRAMVRDLDFPLEVVVAPTVREADGLALSSRNVYLSEEERARARCIPEALAAAERAFARGERAADALLGAAQAVLAREPSLEADYVGLVDPETLDPVDTADQGTLVLAAVRVGRTRLLDNVVLGEPRFATGLAPDARA